MNSPLTFTPIGIIRSCFSEKFGIPRQPGLVPAARATLEIGPPYSRAEAFRGLDAFSHLWIVFVFHGIAPGKWQPTVRPPRLGGNRRIGVFATRSAFRPNPIGLSSVRLESVRQRGDHMTLALAGVDLLDRTPVLDIKPYLPWSDCIDGATGGFAAAPPQSKLTVRFSDAARTACQRVERRYPGFTALVEQVIAADPRPAYGSPRSDFGVRLYGIDVRWTVDVDIARVRWVEEEAGPVARPAGAP